MSRRLVPATFWVGMLVSGLMLVIAANRPADGGSPAPPHLRGTWDGFYLADDGTKGDVQSNITQQDRRRFAGTGVLRHLPTGNLHYEFRGTAAANGLINGTGRIFGGHLVFEGEMTTFPARGGDAGVMSVDDQFTGHNGHGRVSTLLLHPFPGFTSPDITGDALGTFHSIPDPTTGSLADASFRGIARVTIEPRSHRGTFAGHMELSLGPNDPPFLSWPFLSTTSADRQTIWVSQGATGNGVYKGAVLVGQNGQTSTGIWGIFRLNFNDGRMLFNAYNISFAR